MLKKYYKIILALTVAVAISATLPYFNLMRSPNFSWRDPWAVNMNSGGYYLARLHEIKDGNIFLGNPYFIEHQKEIAPAFFIADWAAYLPAFLGLPLEYLALVNLYFWALIFILLAFCIFLKLGISKEISALGALLVYLLGFSLIIDPVSMQTIYPVCLSAWLAFYLWLKDFKNWRKQLFLILSLTACFYVYTYLWQLILTVGFLSLAYFLIGKRKDEFFVLLRILAAAFLLSTPLFVYTFKQLTHPWYWETMGRIGLVNTHLPTAEVFYSGRWVIFSLALWLAPKLFFKKLAAVERYRELSAYFSLTGLALLIVSASNVITGKDLELAQHLVRFIKVWLGFSLVGWLYLIYENRGEVKVYLKNYAISALTAILLLSLIYGVAAYISWPRLIDYSSRLDEDRQIHDALLWLENNETQPAVVMADYKGEANKNLPVLTKHYVLFSAAGILHLLSNQEAERRYLLNGALNNLTLQDVKSDYALYAGNGNAVHPYKVYNRRVKLCKILRLNLLNYDCGQLTDAVSFRGEKYFTELFDKYQKEILPNLGRELKKFNVAYALIDKAKNMNLLSGEAGGLKEVYQNQKFIIYKVL